MLHLHKIDQEWIFFQMKNIVFETFYPPKIKAKAFDFCFPQASGPA